MIISSYSWKISVWKMIANALIIGIIAILTYLVETGLPTLSLELPEYTAIIAIITGLVTALLNWLKHRKDTKVV